MGSGPTRIIQDDLILRSLITSTKIIFPNKAMSSNSGTWIDLSGPPRNPLHWTSLLSKGVGQGSSQGVWLQPGDTGPG